MTVGQLKRVMTLDELKRWRLYEEEFGPFNLALRIERVVALAGAPHLKGNPFKKLMPWPREREAEASIQDAFALLMKVAADGKKAKPKKGVKRSKRGKS